MMPALYEYLQDRLEPGTKTCIIVCGPTASGKSALAIELAQHFNTAIISADSRQCYREMNIGVAKPSEHELNLVPHYFINTHSIQDEVTAADFEQYALETVDQLFKDHDVVIMAGGTGLYIKAFEEGLDQMPSITDEIRKRVRYSYDKEGLEWLQSQLRETDPLFAATGEMQNPQRMMRALEFFWQTGQSIRSFQHADKKVRDFRIIKIAVEWPRDILYQRINKRVDQMVSKGLEAEAKALYPYRNLNALQTVGYMEWFDFFDGKCTREEAIDRIKQNTRHYAKRQGTWFRKYAADFVVEGRGQ